MYYNIICFENQAMFVPAKIDRYYRVTTDLIFVLLDNKMKKSRIVVYQRLQDFFMVGVTGFEPMASWSRSKPIWCIFEFLEQKPLYIVVALDTNGIKKQA